MAKQKLPTNFKDDVLNTSMSGKRKWNISQNSDGTYSITDVTTYDQVGSEFGARNINATNQAVNESFDKNKIVESLDDIGAITESGYVPDALAIKDLNNNVEGVFPNNDYIDVGTETKTFTAQKNGWLWISAHGNAGKTAQVTVNTDVGFPVRATSYSSAGGDFYVYSPVVKGANLTISTLNISKINAIRFY